ncbi:pentatricopeptide repeat-containing protein [Tanacetum coccineum]
MISGYLSNNSFTLARQLFDKMPHRDFVSWNVMITGCVRNGNLGAAMELFDQMLVKDAVSWNAMLSGYAQSGFVEEVRRVFDMIPDECRNSITRNGTLSAYVQNARVDEARGLFEANRDWDVISWNCLMGGYVRKRKVGDARVLFDRMVKRDEVSWNTMISGYAQSEDMCEARKLFDESPVRYEYTWTAMVSGYVLNGMVDEARRIFDEMPVKNSVSWNAMIAGYLQCKRIDVAKEFFHTMPCKNVSSWNTMITGFAHSGIIDIARDLFDKMLQRDCISWGAIISGYAHLGHNEEALRFFVEMKRTGEKANRSIFLCILSTCSEITALELGFQLHAQLVKVGLRSGWYVGNALLSMYCKCGNIDEANAIFEEISDKDIVSWNTIIAGYARHGFGQEALRVFESMKTSGVKPDQVTMVGVLSACSHSGLVDRGTHYFYTMNRDYGIAANSKHYTCMIDLLGRAGRLDDAQILMKSMPFEPDAATWGALLGASRIHGNTELGEKAAEMVFLMKPDNAGMDTGVKKVPDYSWLEVQNKIHTFSVGDSTHPETLRVYAYLEELAFRLKKEGYISSPKLVLHDVEEEEKEHMLRYHSEKLAVAFGILNIQAGRPIRVFKNLRVCADCHNVIKHISKIEGRLIIVRDSHRFHHFRDVIGAGHCPYNHQYVSVEITAKSLCSVPAARLPSNHQYVNVPTQQNHFAQCLQSSSLATSE